MATPSTKSMERADIWPRCLPQTHRDSPGVGMEAQKPVLSPQCGPQPLFSHPSGASSMPLGPGLGSVWDWWHPGTSTSGHADFLFSPTGPQLCILLQGGCWGHPPPCRAHVAAGHAVPAGKPGVRPEAPLCLASRAPLPTGAFLPLHFWLCCGRWPDQQTWEKEASGLY